MSEGLIGDKRRQATDSIRGYVYQAYQSVLAWIRLQEDEVLFLEGAEDFDVHNPEGVTATQVNDTAGSGVGGHMPIGEGSEKPKHLSVLDGDKRGPRVTPGVQGIARYDIFSSLRPSWYDAELFHQT